MFEENFEGLRAKFKEERIPLLSKEVAAVALGILANLKFSSLAKMHWDSLLNQSGMVTSFSINYSRFISGDDGNTYALDDVVPVIYDATKLFLDYENYLHVEQCYSAKTLSDLDAVPWDQVGRHFKTFAELHILIGDFESFLWLDSRYDPCTAILRRENRPLEDAICIGLHRYGAELLEGTLFARPRLTREALGRATLAKRFKIARRNLEDAFASFIESNPSHSFRFMRDQRILPNSSLTLNDVAKVVAVCQAVCEPMVQRYLDRGEGSATLDQFAIKKSDLLEIFQSVLKMNSSDAQAMITFVSYEPQKRINIWSTLFIEAGKFLVPLLGIVLTANFDRFCGKAMSRALVGASHRGRLFERLLFAMLKRRVLPRWPEAKVFRNKKIVMDGPREREIDVGLLLGDRLYIFEAKSNSYPSEAKELYDFITEIAEAAKKLTPITEHLKKVGAIEGVGRFKDVVPIIITDIPILTGYAFDSTPVTDLLTLNQYLDGVIGFAVPIGERNIGAPAHLLQLYTNSDEFGLRIAPYLKDPPQIRALYALVEDQQHIRGMFAKPYSVAIRVLPGDFDQNRFLAVARKTFEDGMLVSSHQISS
jgi:hypothetical protein